MPITVKLKQNHHLTIKEATTMITNPSQFMELQRMHVKAFNTVANALIAGAEKLANLNVTAGRNAIDSATTAAQSLSGVKSPDDLAALSSAAQPSFEKLMNYTRELAGIANGVSADIGKVVEQQISESNKRVAELIEYTTKNAPAGSEQAVAMLRNAVAAGNTAYDSVSKASRQASDWAQANFAAAAKAATTAVAASGATTTK